MTRVAATPSRHWITRLSVGVKPTWNGTTLIRSVMELILMSAGSPSSRSPCRSFSCRSDGGTGDNVVLDAPDAAVTDAAVVGGDWLAANAQVEGGKTVLEVGGEELTLPRASLAKIASGIAS